MKNETTVWMVYGGHDYEGISIDSIKLFASEPDAENHKSELLSNGFYDSVSCKEVKIR